MKPHTTNQSLKPPTAVIQMMFAHRSRLGYRWSQPLLLWQLCWSNWLPWSCHLGTIPRSDINEQQLGDSRCLMWTLSLLFIGKSSDKRDVSGWNTWSNMSFVEARGTNRDMMVIQCDSSHSPLKLHVEISPNVKTDLHQQNTYTLALTLAVSPHGQGAKTWLAVWKVFFVFLMFFLCSMRMLQTWSGFAEGPAKFINWRDHGGSI